VAVQEGKVKTKDFRKKYLWVPTEGAPSGAKILNGEEEF
jgi:hypothetical protein